MIQVFLEQLPSRRCFRRTQAKELPHRNPNHSKKTHRRSHPRSQQCCTILRLILVDACKASLCARSHRSPSIPRRQRNPNLLPLQQQRMGPGVSARDDAHFQALFPARSHLRFVRLEIPLLRGFNTDTLMQPTYFKRQAEGCGGGQSMLDIILPLYLDG
jgi:hypothetical protein